MGALWGQKKLSAHGRQSLCGGFLMLVLLAILSAGANENIGTMEKFTSWLKRAWSPLKVICPDFSWKLFSLELDRSYPQPAMICRSSHVPKTCELLRALAHLVLSLSQVHVAAVEDFADDAAKFMDCFYKVHVSMWAPISERVCACTGLSLGLPLYLCFLFRFVACGQAFSGLAIMRTDESPSTTGSNLYT